MRHLLLVAALALASTPALAQSGGSSATGTGSSDSGMSTGSATGTSRTAPGSPSGTDMNSPSGTDGMGTRGTMGSNRGSNQGMGSDDSTSSIRSGVPARGANSFTESQTRERLTDAGFTDITRLRKSDDGVWMARAMKDGRSNLVALDYQGNVVILR